MKKYKLLTPGPLTTTETVKKEMLFDHCTWDDDYKAITQIIRKELLELAHVSEEEYTVVLMQGSGTFGVESVITSSVGPEEKILVCANGAYGERMAQIAKQAGKNLVVYRENYDKIPDAEKVKAMLMEDPAITHVGMIHSETTSGILNDIESVVPGEELRHFQSVLLLGGYVLLNTGDVLPLEALDEVVVQRPVKRAVGVDELFGNEYADIPAQRSGQLWGNISKLLRSGDYLCAKLVAYAAFPGERL